MLGSFVSLATAANDWDAIDLILGGAGSTSMRTQVQLRANGSTIIVPDYHINISANNTARIRFPLAVAQSTPIEIATRCSTGSTTLRSALRGVKKNGADALGCTTMTAIGVDTSNTRAGSLVLPGTGAWTEVIASTSGGIKALMPVLAEHSTAPATGQRVVLELGLGAAGSEVPFWFDMAHVAVAAPYIPMCNPAAIEQAIPDGQRVSARILAPTGTDSYRLGMWIFT